MKILIVDDDPIILELVRAIVETLGNHTAVTAESANEALKILKETKEPFNCFLFDIQMPDIDGVELCHSVRQIPVYKDQPVIMLTAMTERKYVDAAFAAGATDYITKPFDASDVQLRLETAEKRLETKQSYQKNESAPVFTIHEPDLGQNNLKLLDEVHIHDVDNAASFEALENYLAQLSRGERFPCNIFAIRILEIENYFNGMEAPEFVGLIADIAEAISDSLRQHRFLFAYVGGGAYVCVMQDGHIPDPTTFAETVNQTIIELDLWRSNGERLLPRVCVGKHVRLLGLNADDTFSAVGQVLRSAEEKAQVEHQAIAGDFLSQIAHS